MNAYWAGEKLLVETGSRRYHTLDVRSRTGTAVIGV